MAEPTIKDVLDAIAALDVKLAARIDAIGKPSAPIPAVNEKLSSAIDTVCAKVDAHRLETAAHRLETATGFANLVKQLRRADPAERKREEESSTRLGTVRRPRRA